MVAAVTVGAAIIITGGAAAPIVAAAEGAVLGGTTAGGAAAAAGGAVAAGAAGAGGAAAGGAAVAAGAAAGAGGAGAAAVGAGGAAAAAGGAGGAATAVGVLSGPLGWAVLGCKKSQTSEFLTFDCWKPVLHDKTPELSRGKLLRDVVADTRIKSVLCDGKDTSTFPKIILENIWDEKYLIECVTLPLMGIALHATRVN